ncbi:unnamed protein product [Lampetra planeri]
MHARKKQHERGNPNPNRSKERDDGESRSRRQPQKIDSDVHGRDFYDLPFDLRSEGSSAMGSEHACPTRGHGWRRWLRSDSSHLWTQELPPQAQPFLPVPTPRQNTGAQQPRHGLAGPAPPHRYRRSPPPAWSPARGHGRRGLRERSAQRAGKAAAASLTAEKEAACQRSHAVRHKGGHMAAAAAAASSRERTTLWRSPGNWRALATSEAE